MNFQDLLLPNWCRVHNAAHFEFDCCLCQMAVKHVKESATPRIEMPKEAPIEPPAGHYTDPENFPKIIEPVTQLKGNNNLIRLKDKEPSVCWTLRFDGSKSKQGTRAGFKLISPMSKTFFATHRLQF